MVRCNAGGGVNNGRCGGGEGGFVKMVVMVKVVIVVSIKEEM
jgi:hypothetical protein